MKGAAGYDYMVLKLKNVLLLLLVVVVVVVVL